MLPKILSLCYLYREKAPKFLKVSKEDKALAQKSSKKDKLAGQKSSASPKKDFKSPKKFVKKPVKKATGEKELNPNQ